MSQVSLIITLPPARFATGKARRKLLYVIFKIYVSVLELSNGTYDLEEWQSSNYIGFFLRCLGLYRDGKI